MSFGKDPLGRSGESPRRDERLTPGLLRSVSTRLGRHFREWPKLYVEQRVRAIDPDD